jgi:hypothetical protein
VCGGDWQGWFTLETALRSEPVSEVRVVNHRHPGSAFGNRQEPSSLGGSNPSIYPITAIPDTRRKRLGWIQNIGKPGAWRKKHCILAAALICSVDPMLGPRPEGMRFLIFFLSVSQRTQIVCHWSFPQLRSTEDGVAISAGHIEFQKGALSASTLE